MSMSSGPLLEARQGVPHNDYIVNPPHNQPAWISPVVLLISALLVIAVISVCYWRRGQCLLWLKGRQPGVQASNPAHPQPPQRRAIVRTDLEAGVPGYTLQPSKGELSLGMGRKRSVEEEYELGEMMTDDERPGPEERRVRDVCTSQTASANFQASLPPYIPPPQPAVVTGGSIPHPLLRYSQDFRRPSDSGGQSHPQHN